MAILEETMLVLVSAGTNNNKFYHVRLEEDGTVTKTYGRVGTAGTTLRDSSGKHGYDAIIRQKTKKGYKPTEIAASNIETGGTDKDRVKEIARQTLIQGGSSELERLVDLLVAKNNHEIVAASGGRMEISSDGMITTPLGLVSKQSISRATVLLDQIAPLRHSSRRSAMLNDYLTLVPQKVPARAGWDEKFLADPKDVSAQREFLRQLDESLTLHDERIRAAMTAAESDKDTGSELAEKYADLFRFKVSVLDDSKEFKRIERFYEKGRKDAHVTARGMKLKRIYALGDEPGRARFDTKAQSIGNVKELWHGTRVWNVLSILRQGLLIDAEKVIKTVDYNGKLYGSGIYMAPSGSKSIQYSTGYWDRKDRHNTGFMFLADAALGRTYTPRRDERCSDNHIQRSGNHDAIHAKGGISGVLNDEIIVWNQDQVHLKYLCEFEK